MENIHIITIALILIIVGLGVYILKDNVDICKKEEIRNESFNSGVSQGIDYWNNVIIYSLNTNGEIPYIVNNTIQTLPIRQLCSSAQSGE